MSIVIENPLTLVLLSRTLHSLYVFGEPKAQSKYYSCVIAAHRMIYSFNLPVYLYQLVVTYVICWLPVNKQYHAAVCIMSN
jgi:hypothetical protein